MRGTIPWHDFPKHVLLEHYAATCFAIACACTRSDVRGFFRRLSIDLFIEADKMRNPRSKTARDTLNQNQQPFDKS